MRLRELVAVLTVGCFLLATRSVQADEADDKVQIAKPQDMTLDTKDGVELRCTYYPGGVIQTDRDKFQKIDGKKVVPIMMIHGWGGQRGDFDGLARMLQAMGHAVIVPDLRGHGSSTTQEIPGRDAKTLELDRMNKVDILAMVAADLESVKSFLKKENNDAKLNIEALCVIGSEFGAVLAVNWSFQDWSWRQLPNYKQGQDVKAMVLLSPIRQFKGVSADAAMRHPAIRSQLSVMIVSGRASDDYSDARRLHNNFERYHEEPPQDREERLEKQDLFFISPETSLVGTKLLAGRGLNVAQNIAVFINLRLVNKMDDFKWQDRTNPLAGG